MSLHYKTVDIRSLKGIKEADRIKALGWRICSTGFTTIKFYHLSPAKEEKYLRRVGKVQIVIP